MRWWFLAIAVFLLAGFWHGNAVIGNLLTDQSGILQTDGGGDLLTR